MNVDPNTNVEDVYFADSATTHTSNKFFSYLVMQEVNV